MSDRNILVTLSVVSGMLTFLLSELENGGYWTTWVVLITLELEFS